MGNGELFFFFFSFSYLVIKLYIFCNVMRLAETSKARDQLYGALCKVEEKGRVLAFHC